jgi:hypothetical protein
MNLFILAGWIFKSCLTRLLLKRESREKKCINLLIPFNIRSEGLSSKSQNGKR